MKYVFTKTDSGVETDKKVQTAVAKLEKLKAEGSLTIEAGYKNDHDAYCKITGLKTPVVTAGKKVGDAVNEAVKKVSQIVRNDKQTIIDKKEHARKKCTKNKAED